jgi:hypothetical protein
MSIVAQQRPNMSLEIFHGTFVDNTFSIYNLLFYYEGSISYRRPPYQLLSNFTYVGTPYSIYSSDSTSAVSFLSGTFSGDFNVLSERASIFLEGSINRIKKITSGHFNNMLGCYLPVDTLVSLTYFSTISKYDSWNFKYLPINMVYYSNSGLNTCNLYLRSLPKSIEYFSDSSTGVVGFSGAKIWGGLYSIGSLPNIKVFSLSGGLLPGYYFESGSTRKKGIWGDLSEISNTELTIFRVVHNDISGDIGSFPSTLQIISIAGSNTITGDLTDISSLPLNSITLSGSNTVYGDISNFPSTTKTISLSGNNIVSGDISNLPFLVNNVSITGKNTVYGDISTITPYTKSFTIGGNNELSGDISSIPPSVSTFNVSGNNTIVGDIVTIPYSITSFTFNSKSDNSLYGYLHELPPNIKIVSITLKALSENFLNSGLPYLEGGFALGSQLPSTLSSLTLLNVYVYLDMSTFSFPTTLKTFILSTYNNIAGNISLIPNTMTKFSVSTLGFKSVPLSYSVYGSINKIYGNLANLPTSITYFKASGGKFIDLDNQPIYTGCAIDAYTPGRTWAANMNTIWIETIPGFGLSISEIDSLLIDLARTTWTTGSTIRIFGGCGSWYPSLSVPGVTLNGLNAYTTLLNKSVSMRFNTWNNTGDNNSLNINSLVYSGGTYSVSVSDISVCNIGTGLDLNGATTSFSNNTILTVDSWETPLEVGTTFLWQKSTNFGIATQSTWVVASNASNYQGYTTISLSVSNITVDTWFRSKLTSGSGVNYTDPIKIKVTPMASAGSITGATMVVQGANITFTSGPFVGSLIEWETSTTSSTSGFNIVPNQNAVTFTLNNVSGMVGSKIYVRTKITSGACSIARSLVKTITIT